MKKCRRLANLRLVTSPAEGGPTAQQEQAAKLSELADSLAQRHNVQLTVTYSPTLHDRQCC